MVDDDRALRLAWASVAVADGLEKKWGIDAPALVERLRTLTHPELIALREVLGRWWDLIGGHDSDQALQLAGAKIKD